MGLAWLRIVLVVAVACGGPKLNQRTEDVDLSKHIPATLEAARPRDGDPKTLQVRVYVDAGVRALPRWKDEITDQIDYASQLLTPLLGTRLAVEKIVDWNRAGDPGTALTALVATDKGDGAAWVIGYVTPRDSASKVLGELGAAEPLGKHVIVRGWVEAGETAALAGTLPDLKETERTEIIAAHRRHKQTVVLVHQLAITLGSIAEADPTQIRHPTYSPKQHTLSDRNRELMQIAVDERAADSDDQTIAKKLIDSIDKTPWGGWIPTDQEQVLARLRILADVGKAGRTAADVPPAAVDQFNRIKELAKQGKSKDALVELDNLMVAYPGNASMMQLKCEILLRAPGIADPSTKAACKRASELAPGDPTPHLAVAEALLAAKDMKGARAELLAAEGKIANLPSGTADAWKKVIAFYVGLDAVTWADEAIGKAKLPPTDPFAVKVAQTRARFGLPRGSKFAPPEQEGALVRAIRGALDLIYAGKYGPAGTALANAEKQWPRAPGLAGARCDLGLRSGAIDAARGACARALAADPNLSWALYLSAVIDLKTAAGTKAGIEKLKKAIAVDPDLGQAWRTLAKAYDRQHDKAALEKLAQDYQTKFGQPLPP